WAMLVVGSGVALSLPMALWSTVTYTRERFDIAQGIAIAESLLRLPVTYWVLSQDYGIVGLALGTTGLQLAAWLTRMVVAYRLMPGLRLDPRLFDRGSIRELSSFGLYNVVVNAADRVVLSTDMILIVAIAPLGAIYYGNGSILIPYFVQVVLMVTWTLTPYATKCDARGDREALRGLLRNGTRGSLFLAAVVAAGLLLTGDAFLDLWIKTESHLRSPDHASAFTILVILTWATLVRSSSSAGRQILFGMRRMGLLAGLSLAEALLNLGISIGLIYAMGIAGVAIGSLIPVVLIYGVVQNLYLLKALEMSPVSFFALLLRSSAPAMLAMAGVSWWVDTWLAVDSWPRLIGKALLLVAAALLVGYWVVLEPRERRALLGRFRLTSHVPPPRT
ncbi:MAG: polysaccharide biosynthesis C-terminal domain-containing protein, partial [Planctomycetes bacterium]|nr:polysaccharide biosynthesis C-terminal domain-containing protein [Planctomycetota bacterium]